MSSYLDLYDYRLQVLALYRERDEAEDRAEDPRAVLERFRARRDALFASHPQSALDEAQRVEFQGLSYFPYSSEARVDAVIDTDVEPQTLLVETSGEESMPMRRVGQVRFSWEDRTASLSLYWIDVYGGGLFLPFRDAGAPAETYGGGRYLFDTVKGSTFRILDRSAIRWRIVLDFNYAYNPSCAYNPHWACPLAPPENRLAFPVRAGEKTYTSASGY